MFVNGEQATVWKEAVVGFLKIYFSVFFAALLYAF
jgi:hypothetical protein